MDKELYTIRIRDGFGRVEDVVWAYSEQDAIRRFRGADYESEVDDMFYCAECEHAYSYNDEY